jgi:hypothetical protein
MFANMGKGWDGTGFGERRRKGEGEKGREEGEWKGKLRA